MDHLIGRKNVKLPLLSSSISVYPIPAPVSLIMCNIPLKYTAYFPLEIQLNNMISRELEVDGSANIYGIVMRFFNQYPEYLDLMTFSQVFHYQETHQWAHKIGTTEKTFVVVRTKINW